MSAASGGRLSAFLVQSLRPLRTSSLRSPRRCQKVTMMIERRTLAGQWRLRCTWQRKLLRGWSAQKGEFAHNGQNALPQASCSSHFTCMPAAAAAPQSQMGAPRRTRSLKFTAAAMCTARHPALSSHTAQRGTGLQAAAQPHRSPQSMSGSTLSAWRPRERACR